MKFTEPTLYNQWPDLFDKTANWQDFTFIRLEVENDRITGSFTFMLALLGLNFSWTLVYDEKHWDSMTERVDELLKTIDRKYEVTTREIDTNG